jgi:hypothetical protein
MLNGSLYRLFIQHSTFNTQHSTFGLLLGRARLSIAGSSPRIQSPAQ